MTREEKMNKRRETGKTYKLGQRVDVVVKATDKITRTIDFDVI